VGSRTDLGQTDLRSQQELQFLVRWKGYSPAHDQWVNREDMAADDLVRIFERENPHKPPVQRPARSKRIRQSRWTLTVQTSHLPGSLCGTRGHGPIGSLGQNQENALGAIFGSKGAHTD